MTFTRCFLVINLVISISSAHHDTLDLLSPASIGESIVYVRAPRANGNVDPSTLEVITSSFPLMALQTAADSTMKKTDTYDQDIGLVSSQLKVTPESDSLTLELSDRPVLTTLKLEHDGGTERSRRKVLKHVIECILDDDGFHKENTKQMEAANFADDMGKLNEKKLALGNKNEQLRAPTKYDLFSKTDEDESLFEFTGTTDENIFESGDIEEFPFEISAPASFDIFSEIANVTDLKVTTASAKDSNVSTNAITGNSGNNSAMPSTDDAFMSTETITNTTIMEVTEIITNIQTTIQSQPSEVALDDVDIGDEATDILVTNVTTNPAITFISENISEEIEKALEKNTEVFVVADTSTSGIVKRKDLSLESTTISSAITIETMVDFNESKKEPTIGNKTDNSYQNKSTGITTNNNAKTTVSDSALGQTSLEEDEKVIGNDTKALSNLTDDIVSKVDSLYEQASPTKKLMDKEEEEIRKTFREQYDDIEEAYQQKNVIQEAVNNVNTDKKLKGIEKKVVRNKKNNCLNNADREAYIVRMILGNSANFSIQIRIENTSFFIPKDVAVLEDSTNMLLNFTWRSMNRRLNNSLSLMLTQISNYYLVTGVKLSIMKFVRISYGCLRLALRMKDSITTVHSDAQMISDLSVFRLKNLGSIGPFAEGRQKDKKVITSTITKFSDLRDNKGDEMFDWIKNEVMIPKRRDVYAQLELTVDMDDEVTITISNINFLKINHDEGPAAIDIDDALLQMEITVAISAFCTVIVIGILSLMIYYVIVRKKRRLFDFKNKKICPL